MNETHACLFLALASCAFTSLAHAAGPVVWSAPPECPQESSFHTQLEWFLGHSAQARDPRRIEITGDVRKEAARGYVAELRVDTARGAQRRELSHVNCFELTEAAALVAALAIDPQLSVPERPVRFEPTPPSPGAAAAAAPPPQPSPAAAPALPVSAVAADPSVQSRSTPSDVPPPQPTVRKLYASITALGLVGSAVLPDVGIGFGAQAMLGQRRFRLSARGSYWHSRFRALDGGAAGPGIELGAWGVGVKACGLPWTGEVTVAACLGPELGDMYGAGDEALLNARTVHERWSALVAELSLAISSSSGLTTLLGVELGKTLEAPVFGVRRDGRDLPVFEANAWTFNGFVGLGLFR